MARAATAIERAGEGLLVADAGRVHLHDPRGRRQRAVAEVGSGVTALLLGPKNLVAGFAGGTVELFALNRQRPKPTYAFEGVPASPVTRIIAGAEGTVVIGFGSGEWGIWHVATGIRLHHDRLHGPVVHLLHRRQRLYVASELGDHRALDIGVLSQPYCTMMRQIWRQVPIVWVEGQLVRRPAPLDHRCAGGS